MANDSVGLVDDSESKIVTKFLLNTCRLLQPTRYHVQAAEICANWPPQPAVDKDRVIFIPLTTGSVAEFYIQPMLSCVGDIDVMVHNITQLAIPYGYPPPSQLPAEFHSRVEVCEIIDSKYPGYVYLMTSYLLTENTGADKFDAMQYDRRDYVSYDKTSTGALKVHGPALTLRGMATDFDSVSCLRCLSWPMQAADWPKRYRNYGWPDLATVDRVVSNGCDVVRVAHRLCKQCEWVNKHQWRLSFSRAEIVLINSWMPIQQIVYHMLRVFVKTQELTHVTDNTGTKMISNYHIKTLMLWACELKPKCWWTDDLNVVRICVLLMHIFANWLESKNYPHYFVNNCSLIDTTLHVEIITSQLMPITESWLATWFMNNYVRKCAQFCPKGISRLFDDVSTSMKLENAVSAIVDWRLNREQFDLWALWYFAEVHISSSFSSCYLTARACHCWINELAKIEPYFRIYFTAVAFLVVFHKASRNGLNHNLIDVLTTILGQHYHGRLRYKQLSGMLSLTQAATLMKVSNNSRRTVQLIEIKLSKAHLYRALRCKDSESDYWADIYMTVKNVTSSPLDFNRTAFTDFVPPCVMF